MGSREYGEDDLPGYLEIIDQSENFIFIRHWSGAVMIGDLEALMLIGLQCCGISTDSSGRAVIGCMKVAKCGY